LGKGAREDHGGVVSLPLTLEVRRKAAEDIAGRLCGLMSLELEIEKIRAVRRGIAQQFDSDVAKLGEYYRKQELPLNSAAQAKPASSEAKDGTEAAGHGRKRR
jgi:hypothetical protein